MPDDPYTLPADDPCHSTVAAFQQIAGAVADAYWQAAHYQRFGQLDAWQHCCPELREKAAALRLELTDPSALQSFVFPSGDLIFAAGGLCAQHLSVRGIADTGGTAPLQVWLKQHNTERFGYWDQTYTQLSTELLACCRQQLRSCVIGILDQSPLNPASMAATDRCLVRFDPSVAGRAPGVVPAPFRAIFLRRAAPRGRWRSRTPPAEWRSPRSGRPSPLSPHPPRQLSEELADS